MSLQALWVNPKMSARARITGKSDKTITLSLTKSIVWTFIGNSTFAAGQWIIIIVIARMGSPADVGAYAFATAICGPVINFSKLKLRSVQASDAKLDYQFGTYLALRIVTSIVSVAVIVILSVMLPVDTGMKFVIISSASFKIIDTISDILYGFQQQHERLDIVSKSLIAKGIVFVLVFGAVYAATHSLSLAAVGVFIGWFFVLIVYDAPRAQHLGGISLNPNWDWVAIRQLFFLTLPLGITVALNSLQTSLPRYFIQGTLSTVDLGIFASVSYFLVVSGLVISAVGQAATPRLAKLYRNGDLRGHLRLTLLLLSVGSALGIVGVIVSMAIGRQLLEVVYGGAYGDNESLLVWLMINNAITFGYVFLGTALTSMKKFRVQLPVHMAGLCVLLLSCWIMIPQHGLLGAAWAMLASNGFQALAYLVLLVVYFARYEKVGLNDV